MSQHVSLEDLLALRDGRDPSRPDAAEQLESCSSSQAELERLVELQRSMSELEAPAPPRDLWPEVRQQIERQQRSRRMTQFLAAAAGLLAIALLAGIGPRWNRAPSPSVETDVATTLIDLQEQSQHLDAAMSSLGLEQRALNGWQAETIVALEDQLASVDQQLSSGTHRNEEELELWQERLFLQDALFRVHIDSDGVQNL
ncbi:MAG: hypothetical protein AAGK22_14070 [Acidobacteriota bacterium]